MNPKGTLYIVTAASGTGKTSLTDAIIATMTNIKISISHTTRSIRANERANEHYFFVTPQEFELLIQQNVFLEYAQVFGNYYGTSRDWVREQLAVGVDIILDIDWQGAQKIRKQMDCVTIFLLPPSRAELRLRLEKRGSDDVKTIEKRLAVASSEIAHYGEFDYIVINDKFEEAVTDLQAIIRSQRLQLRQQMVRHGTLVKELLGATV
jgi:guanylate kinase